MRTRYAEFVEAGRIRQGRFASNPGDGCGAFLLRHDKSGQFFQIIAGDAVAWAAERMPDPPWEHVSVKCKSRSRLPTWEEMCWVKNLFWGEEECVVQYHPPQSEYVNDNTMVLHLWKPAQGVLPLPPRECV